MKVHLRHGALFCLQNNSVTSILELKIFLSFEMVFELIWNDDTTYNQIFLKGLG